MNTEDDFDLVPADDGGLPAPYYAPQRAPADYYSGLPVVSDRAGEMPDASRGQHSAAPTVFGQRLPPGVSPQQAQRHLDGLSSYFTQAMHQQGVPQQHANAARAWFRQAARGPAPHEWPAHGYDVSRFGLTQADMPLATSFLNVMHRSRVPKPAVHRMLAWYTQLVQRLQQQRAPVTQQPSYGPTLDTISDEQYRYVMQHSEANRRRGLDHLRVLWGADYQSRLRVVRQYFAGLPADERDYLESAVLQGGVIAADSSEIINKLYEQAVMGNMPTGGALQQEIASLEMRMRTDRKAWDKDEKSHLRLRALYRLRDGE